MPAITEKEQKAVELQKAGKTLSQIGALFGLSRERARQLIQSHNYKKGQGVFSELLTRSQTVLRNLDIKTVDELRKRFPEFKYPKGSPLKYKWRGCGDLVYNDIQQFLKRHDSKRTNHKKS